MTRWTMRKKTRGVELEIFKYVEGQPETFLGDTSLPIESDIPPLHRALAEVAQFYEPGDVVFTPEGPSVVHAQEGEPNN
jgi:hypothetical protein